MAFERTLGARQRLYGLRFDCAGVPVWHDDVMFYDAALTAGSVVGLPVRHHRLRVSEYGLIGRAIEPRHSQAMSSADGISLAVDAHSPAGPPNADESSHQAEERATVCE